MMKINMGGRKSQASKLNAHSKLRRTIVVVNYLLVALSLLFFIQHPFMLLEHHQVQNDQVATPTDFTFGRVAVVIAYDRFEFFRQTIDHLRRAWGSEHYTVLIKVDGPPTNRTTFDEEGWLSITQYAQDLEYLSRRGIGFKEVHVDIAGHNIGLWPNKKRGVEWGFEMSDFVVVLEDDITLDVDALEWFEWHVTSGLIFNRPEIALASCWSPSFPYDKKHVEGHDLLLAAELNIIDKYHINPWATPWGWATWRTTWNELGSNWTGQDRHLGNMVKDHQWFETQPLVSRCNNIGSYGAHKLGRDIGHIHQRTFTSGSFINNAKGCSYRELASTKPIYDLLRIGIFQNRKLENSTMQQILKKVEETWEENKEIPWNSTC
jgi:hypothetical protein